MNTKIMGLHTKLTNLVFHEIDRHLDRLNMNEEPVNNCNPENQHQKAENAKVPNNTGRESTEYNLRDIESLAPSLTGQPLILGNHRKESSLPRNIPTVRSIHQQAPVRKVLSTPIMQQQPLVSDVHVAPSYVTHQQTLGRIVPLLPTAHKQQPAHQTVNQLHSAGPDILGSNTQNQPFLTYPSLHQRRI